MTSNSCILQISCVFCVHVLLRNSAARKIHILNFVWLLADFNFSFLFTTSFRVHDRLQVKWHALISLCSCTDMITFHIVIDRMEVSCAYCTCLILCHFISSCTSVICFYIYHYVYYVEYYDVIQPGLTALSTEHISVVVFSSLVTVCWLL